MNWAYIEVLIPNINNRTQKLLRAISNPPLLQFSILISGRWEFGSLCRIPVSPITCYPDPTPKQSRINRSESHVHLKLDLTIVKVRETVRPVI